jgi:hypothetical protein
VLGISLDRNERTILRGERASRQSGGWASTSLWLAAKPLHGGIEIGRNFGLHVVDPGLVGGQFDAAKIERTYGRARLAAQRLSISTQSSTVCAIGPIVSSVRDNGNTPCLSIRPRWS